MATRTVKQRSAQRLIVFVPPQHALADRGKFGASSVVNYVSLGTTIQGGNTPIALLPKAAQVELVFSAADVFSTSVAAPRLADAKLRQALPNLLEERLLAPPADGHYAFTPLARTSGTTTIATTPRLPVAVIDRGLLTRSIDALNEGGLNPRMAYSELYTLPAPAPGTLSVRVAQGQGVARSTRHDGVAFEFDGKTVPPALQLAVRQLGVQQILAFGDDAAKLAALAEQLGARVSVSKTPIDANAADDAVNLLQGAFASGGLLGGMALPRMNLRALRAPLIWLGVAVAVFIAGMNAYWGKLATDATGIRDGMVNAFRSQFPNASAADPGLVVELARRELGNLRARAGLASPSDFSVLTAQAAQLLASAPIGSIAGVEYADGALRVKFKQGAAGDAGLQNALRAQAVQMGLNLRFDADGSARLAPVGG